MGLIISRFRKKKSTIEILEAIDKDIQTLQRFRRQNQLRQKRFIGHLILYSILLYIIGALVFYFYYFPKLWKQRLLYSLPLILFPFLIWGIKKILHWYYVKRIAGNDFALEELREKKKQILEDVMETETYKKAKEILEKFDPARFKELEQPKETPLKSPTPGTELRRRIGGSASPPSPPIRPGVTPMVPRGMTPAGPRSAQVRIPATPHIPAQGSPGMRPRNILATPQVNGGYETPRGPPLPRPVLPRDRGAMDRMLEYLVGDGPQNRYALICRYCHSHNGMALKEEFEYLSYRCCYCYAMNPAKKQRPFAPRIEPPPQPPVPPRTDVEGSGSSEEDDEDDEDGDDNDDDNGATGTSDPGRVNQGQGSSRQSSGEESMDKESPERCQQQHSAEVDKDRRLPK